MSLLFIGCLTFRPHARVSQGRICSDKCTCCHTELEVIDTACYLIQSQYTDIRPTSSSADPITPGGWPGNQQCTSRWVTGTRDLDRSLLVLLDRGNGSGICCAIAAMLVMMIGQMAVSDGVSGAHPLFTPHTGVLLHCIVCCPSPMLVNHRNRTREH